MNRFLLLVLIALIAFAVIFFIQRPEVISEIWLWLVGLAGLIIQGFKNLFSFFQKEDEKSLAVAAPSAIPAPHVPTVPSPAPAPSVPSAPSAAPVPTPTTIAQTPFNGVTLTVLRYSDDGTTTVGLLYLNGHYYCYTLEDTFRAQKIAGQTRIPAGEYVLDFIRQETELTKKYRSSFPDWFVWHLEIKKVPGFTGVYIHSGGDHTHTAGCLLVADSLTRSAEKTFLTNSRNTFKKLYTYLKDQLNNGVSVRIVIRDESWFNPLTQ